MVSELTKSLLYSRGGYFALVNPAGVAAFVSTQRDHCLGEFFNLRFGRKVADELEIKRAASLLKASGWHVVPAKMAIFTEDVDPRKLALA
jgi:hypothetical protein